MSHRVRLAHLLGVGLLVAGPLAAQQGKRSMDVADVFRFHTLQRAELSPDGRWVVYEVQRLEFPDWKRVSDLFVVSADGRTTRQLTFTEGESESGPTWRPGPGGGGGGGGGGGLIGFTSSREEKKRQLFLIRPDGGEARKVTDADDGVGEWAWNRDGSRLAYLAGPEGKRQVWLLPGDGSGKAEQLSRHATDISAFAWSEDGKAMLFVAPDEPDSTRRKRMKDKFDVRVTNEAEAASHLWRLDVTGKSETRLTQGAFRVSGLELSRDGRWAAFRGAATDRYADMRAGELYLLEVATGKLERLTNNFISEGNPSFSPDSRLLALVADRDFRYGNLSRVYVRPVTGGEWRELGRGSNLDVGLDFWSTDGRRIYFDGSDGVNRNVYELDVASGAIRQVTRLEAVVGTTKPRQSESVLVRYADPKSPTDLYLVPIVELARKERWVRLTSLNPWVDSVALGRYETVRWRAGDGARVEGILVYPVNHQPERRAPLIVQLHGGPASAYQNGFSANYGTYTQVLAGKGYAVLQPNYRGSTGYGEAFQSAISGNYWPLAQDDIMSGVDTVIGRGIAHADSLGMMGWSAGGHWSNWTLVTTDRFKAISSGAGVSNWISLYAQTDVQATREYYLGGDASREAANKPWDNYEHWWEESPLRYIKRAKTPILLHNGERDPRIPMPQNQELHMALKKLGVPTEFLVYPGQPHGLQEPRYQLVKMLSEIGWFERWIRGREPWLDWNQVLATARGISGQPPAVRDSVRAAAIRR